MEEAPHHVADSIKPSIPKPMSTTGLDALGHSPPSSSSSSLLHQGKAPTNAMHSIEEEEEVGLDLEKAVPPPVPTPAAAPSVSPAPAPVTPGGGPSEGALLRLAKSAEKMVEQIVGKKAPDPTTSANAPPPPPPLSTIETPSSSNEVAASDSSKRASFPSLLQRGGILAVSSSMVVNRSSITKSRAPFTAPPAPKRTPRPPAPLPVVDPQDIKSVFMTAEKMEARALRRLFRLKRNTVSFAPGTAPPNEVFIALSLEEPEVGYLMLYSSVYAHLITHCASLCWHLSRLLLLVDVAVPAIL